MSQRWFRLGWPPLVLLGIALGGCAQSPTVVMTELLADQTVPPLLLLNAMVASQTDATKQAFVHFVSLAVGDASDRPGPYVFPLTLPVPVTSSLAGPVTITIEGVDEGAGAVLARGSASTQVIGGQQTRAVVTLTAVTTVGADAGTIDGEGADGEQSAGDAASDP